MFIVSRFYCFWWRQLYSVEFSNSKNGTMVGRTDRNYTRAMKFGSCCEEKVNQSYRMFSNSRVFSNNLRQMEDSGHT